MQSWAIVWRELQRHGTATVTTTPRSIIPLHCTLPWLSSNHTLGCCITTRSITFHPLNAVLVLLTQTLSTLSLPALHSSMHSHFAGHGAHDLLLRAADCLSRPIGTVEPCQHRLAAVVVTRWLTPLPVCAAHLHAANPMAVSSWLGPAMSVDSARAASVVIPLLRGQLDKSTFTAIVTNIGAALDVWSVTSAAAEVERGVRPLALCCALADILLQHREILNAVRATGELRRVCVSSACYHVRVDDATEPLAESLDGLGKLLRILWSQLGGNLPPELHQMYTVLASVSADEDAPPPPLAPIMCRIPEHTIAHAAEMLAASAAPSAESTAGVVYVESFSCLIFAP